MSKIFVGQSNLRIQVTTGVDITGALSLKIKYRKPNNIEAEWTATEHTASTGIIYYDLTATTDLDVAGVWTFWAYIMFSDGSVAPGDSFEQLISAEGS